MHKYRHLSVALISGLLLIGLIVLYGCGGSSGGHHNEPSVERAIREYEAADTASEFEATIQQVDDVIGVNNSSGPLSAFAMTGEYEDSFAERSAFFKSLGTHSTVEEFLAGWRAGEGSTFNVPTATFVADLNGDIIQARQNPNGTNAQLLLAIDRLGQALNDNSGGLTANTRGDLLFARLMSIWSIQRYGADGNPLTRDAAACEACKTAHKAACEATYQSTLANLRQTRDAGLTMMNEARAQGLSQADYQYGVNKFNSDYNKGAFEAGKALNTCNAGAAAACAEACHEQ